MTLALAQSTHMIPYEYNTAKQGNNCGSTGDDETVQPHSGIFFGVYKTRYTSNAQCLETCGKLFKLRKVQVASAPIPRPAQNSILLSCLVRGGKGLAVTA